MTHAPDAPPPGKPGGEPARSNLFDRAVLGLAWVGAACLLALVAVIAAGVAMRYLFGQPILGSNEIVQLTAVALAMCALPWCTAAGGHVGVDVFDGVLGARGRLFGDLLCAALSIFVLGKLAHRAGIKALDALEWGDATNMLGLPIWPFHALLAAGAALSALVFVLRAFGMLTGRIRP